MIKYICPSCGCKFRAGVALIGFETRLAVYLTPTSKGIAIGVESTPRMDLSKVSVKQMKCPECGEVMTSALRYAISCGNCDAALGETDNPQEAVERFCRDAHLIYCSKCWEKLMSRFCEVCQYASECTALQVNRR